MGQRVALSEDAFADYVTADAMWLAPVPEGVDACEATILSMTGPLALRLLRAARAQPGDTILVQAAAGGVGHLVAQLAKLLGSTVIGTASSPIKLPFVRTCGADVAIDSSDPEWPEEVRAAAPRGVDIVLDAVGAAARDEGRFTSEIIPVTRKQRNRETEEVEILPDQLVADECIRSTSMDALSSLKPAFVPNGRVTAGNASQIADGAAAILVMSEAKAHELGLHPRVAIRHMAVVGTDPVEMLGGPIAATQKVLDRAHLTMEDIERFEVNEAFASVVLAWQRALKADDSCLNVNGGGIALGHPLGATGAKLAVTLVHELERVNGRFGLQAVCEGGGMANATLFERLP